MFPYFPNLVETLAAERTADLHRAAALHRAARQIAGAAGLPRRAARRPWPALGHVSRVAPACPSAAATGVSAATAGCR
jgi:hypothetical protein